MRFLMACLQFPTEPGGSFMTTELAQALITAGHEVEVLLIDWTAPPGSPDGTAKIWNGVRLVRCTPRLVDGLGGLARKASKFLLTGRRAGRLAREAFDLERFDALIAWGPAVIFPSLGGMAKRAGVKRRLLFIWDFFPDHFHQIGLI